MNVNKKVDQDGKEVTDPFTGEVEQVEESNYKYWGSYQQGVIKEADRTTELCSNRYTYIIVTAITDYQYNIDITFKSKQISYEAAKMVEVGILASLLTLSVNILL
jgi:hypothetical protein